jgi:uncharacterized damage-inducible protein DinB
MSELLSGGLVPRHQLAERDMLLAYLARQRELVFWKLEGLDDERARAVATPTGMGIHGIVQHLEGVERSWLRAHVDGQPGLRVARGSDEDGAGPEASMQVPPGVPLTDLLASYRAEIARCDRVVQAHALDDVSAERDHTLRWVLMHLIEEVSRHVGHLDLLAELADGRVGEEPEGAPAPGVDPED